MDALALLKRQHREVERLFKEAEKAEGAGERRKLCDEIKAKLELHTRLEEEIFYPAVREVNNRKAGEMVAEAYEEHAVVKMALQALPRTDPADERFHAKITVLKELVKHHVDEEEKEMFKLAQKLGRDELRDLGQRMADEVPEEDRPASPRRRAA